jgi:SpoVK/Ycf46/Vps4 family AAA+-type ATPase
MRISLINIPAERRVTIYPIKASTICDTINLIPTDVDEKILKLSSFTLYLQMYLSNAFLIEGSRISVKYFGQSLHFKLPESLVSKLSALSVGETNDRNITVIKLNSKPKICFTSTLSSAEKDTVDKVFGFDRIGGLTKAKYDLTTFLIDPVLKSADACSVILWGLTGTGKTLILQSISELLPGRCISLESISTLSESFSQIGTADVLLLDNFESIKPESKNSETTADLLCRIIDEKRFKAIVMVARSIESIDLRLRRRFVVEIELMVPNPIEREEILRKILGQRFQEDRIRELARETHGFTGADLVAMCRLSEHVALEQTSSLDENVINDCFTVARRRIRPTGLRQFILEIPNVKWEDIGGEEKLKQEIEQAVIWPFKHPEAFKRLGVDPPSGILLFGPPGCSKTSIARAIAAQSKFNFLSVKGPELFSKWVGESERAVRELFHRARQVAPAVLFFDEIDAVASSRGGDSSSGVSDRVLAQLLTELDGLEKTNGVIVLAATNRPEILDGAILRPGRLDRSLYVTLPDKVTRHAIIELQLKKMTAIDTNIDIEMLSERTDGYSGAEIVALCKNAAFIAMRDNLHSAQIEAKHFEAALSIIVPRTNRKTLF